MQNNIRSSGRPQWFPLLFAFALLVALLAAPAAKACPFCADNLPSAHSNDDVSLSAPGVQHLQSPALAEGFYYSILLMVSVPYVVLGGIGYYIWRLLSKNQTSLPVMPGHGPPGQLGAAEPA